MTNFNFFSRLESWMNVLSSRIRPVSLSYSGSSTIACSTERQPRDNREMSERQSGSRVAREWLKYAALFPMLFTFGIGNAWGVVNGDLFERISAAPAANDEVIFVNQAETYACGTTQNTNNRTPVAITTSSNQYIYNSSNNVQVFVVKINSSSKYGFHTGSGYIYSASSTKNYLNTNSTAASTAPSVTSAWSMSCTSNVWSVTNVSNTSYYLAFNGTSYFSQYKSGQSKPYIYKKVMSAPTAVAASSITSSGATITITDATDVNNYELYYSTSSTAPTAGTTATTTITGGKSKTLTGLSASTNYYLWARAFSTSPARKTGWVALSGSYFTTSASSKTLSSIAITNAPSTTKYLVGETFSKTGAVVTATYSDATTANVSASATWTPTTGLVAGSNTITASYTEGGVTKTATTTVTAYSVTVQKQDEDGTTIADAGVTASATGRTLSASGGSTNYVFKQWKFGTASGTSIASSSSASTSLTGTPTAAVTVIAEFYKPITITYKANGSTFTTQAYGYGGTLAFPASKPDGATYSCTGKTFVGWVGEANKDYSDASTPPTYATAGGSVTAAATYYAVFADATPGGVSWTQTTSVSVGDSVIIAEIDHVADGKTGKELTGFSITSTVYGLSADYASTPAGTKKWKVVTGYNSTGVAFQSGSDYLYWTSGNSLNVNSELSAYTSWTVTTESSRAKIANNNTSTRIICWNSGSPRFACYSGKSHGEEISSGSGTYYYYPVFYKKTGGVTYSNYATTCCEPLASVNGSVSFTNPTTAVVKWDMIGHVDSWTLKYKESDDDDWTTAYTAKTSSDSEISTLDSDEDDTDDTYFSTISSLTCGTDYDFQIIATPDDGYCDKEEELTNKNSGKWDLDYTLTGVSLKSGDLDEGTGVLCGDLVITIEPLSVAYELPSDVTVTIGGATKTIDTDYLWDPETGELVIYDSEIDGNVAIEIEGVLVGCSADPEIGAASLSGAFGLSSVGVTVGTSRTGSAYCAWTDYGFVWGTSTNPTVSDNKVQIGNSDAATTWSGNLTGSFSTGTTYYFRAYGKNSKDDATYVYGEGGSFTPRSVTFDSNGGSAVATAYVNSGSAVSEPSAPTRTGYDFNGWQLSGADYSFSSAVSANITLDAVWSAKTYTVTLAKNYGSAGSTEVTATYDAAMPNMGTKPGREGYTFTGYFDDPDDGEGKQYYNADKSSASNWDKAANSTLYAHWQANNYTITLNNAGADTGKEGTTSISVTYDANTNLTSAITKPEKEGYVFSGYYTEADGAGTAIIGADGYVIAGVSNYTSASKQWKKASDVPLYAYWRPSYTVTWYVNGKTTTEQVVSGEKVAALPTKPTTNDCDKAKVFVGWLASEIDGVSASEPSGLFATQSSSPVITENTTFYAVFADEGVGSRTTLYYEPFKTAANNTDWSDAGDYFDNTNTASITTTTSWKVSKSTTSPSDYDGASEGSHMFCGSNNQSIVFDFGDKSNYVNLQLSFGFKNEAAKDKARTIGCYVSGNGGESWTDNLISVSTITDQNWHTFSYNISNENIGALQIKFSTLAANPSRVDDIKLTGCAKTYSNYVTYCTNEFNDNKGNGLWSDPANWTSGVVPSIHHSIHLTKPMTIDVPNAQAKEIIIDKSESKTGQLVISANMSLEVAGTITRENGSAPTADDLLLESGASGNATLIFDNSNSAAATVQMYSKATAEGGWTWQYIAAPAAVSALDNYYGGYLYKWVESSWAAVGRDATMELFAGYCVSYPTAGHTFAIEGALAPTTSKSITVPEGKSKVVGNSWTAPIQITQLEEEDFSGLLKNVYLYNTGNDESGKATTTSSPTGDAIYAAGTYISVPIHSAEYTDVKVISSLQGFFVKDDDTQAGGGTLSLSYSKHVRPSGGNSVVNGAMHAPKRVADETDRPAVLKMKVSGSQYDDRLILLEREDFTTGYDAGWDGDKMGDVATSPRITTTREDGTADAVAALPDLEGTLINFRAASTDDQYTLYFDYETEDAEPLYLLDLTNNAYTRVETGSSYTFVTTDKADHKRFALTRYRAPQITTGVEDASEDNGQSKAVKFIENDKLYILRNGVLYDGTGKKVIEN